MRLNQTFLESLAAAVAEKLDTSAIEERVANEASIDSDQIMEQVVEQVANDIRQDRITDDVIEKLVEDIDTGDICEKVTEEIINRLLDDSDFIDTVSEAVAQRVVALLVEEPVVRQTPVPVVAEEPRLSTDLASGPMACSKCGGSVFMHRNGTCPTIPAVVA